MCALVLYGRRVIIGWRDARDPSYVLGFVLVWRFGWADVQFPINLLTPHTLHTGTPIIIPVYISFGHAGRVTE